MRVVGLAVVRVLQDYCENYYVECEEGCAFEFCDFFVVDHICKEERQEEH